MFKVSFKDTNGNASKVIEKVGKTTTVILRGSMVLPEFWFKMPSDIVRWIEGRTKVELYENMANNTLTIYSSGVSKCNDGDKYNSLLGERIAESRAKLNIYTFIHTLCKKLIDYYCSVLVGDIKVNIEEGVSGSLTADANRYMGMCIKEAHHIADLLKDREDE